MIADTTCAIAASVEAKRFGVKTLTNVADAKRLCPRSSSWVRPAVYVEFHQRAKTVIESVAPIASVNSMTKCGFASRAVTSRDLPPKSLHSK